MWSSWIRKKNATYVMYIAKLRDGSKRVKNFFQKQFSGRVKMERERENGLTHEDLKLECFSPL
jgi:hypothetical protein